MKTIIVWLTVLGTLVVATTAAIRAQTPVESPSELLEKGIYNQDTKGDLDSAIAIYQQVVSESNNNHQIAAHAQFRLGQCYLKKNQPADATAAFEKLIHDFPNEKALIAQAREY